MGPGLNVSTTPITEMGCRQCLPLSVVQLKDKHCRKPHCRNGVLDTFGPNYPNYKIMKKIDNFKYKTATLKMGKNLV